MNKNGEPGRTPNTFAPLTRGVFGAGGVRMTGAAFARNAANQSNTSEKTNFFMAWECGLHVKVSNIYFMKQRKQEHKRFLDSPGFAFIIWRNLRQQKAILS
jgi:hypothetical protein